MLTDEQHMTLSKIFGIDKTQCDLWISKEVLTQPNSGFETRIMRLSAILQIEDDCDVSRCATMFLRHMQEALHTGILHDQVTEPLQQVSNENTAITYCQYAAMLGAKSVFNFLCEKFPACRLDNNSSILAYVVCSQDAEWVTALAKQYSLDLRDPELCVWIYAQRLNIQSLLSLAVPHSTQEPIKPPTQFFVKKLSIPESVSEQWQDLIRGYTRLFIQTLRSVDESTQRIILHLLYDNHRDPARANQLVQTLLADPKLYEQSHFIDVLVSFRMKQQDYNENDKTAVFLRTMCNQCNPDTEEKKSSYLFEFKKQAYRVVFQALAAAECRKPTLTENELRRLEHLSANSTSVQTIRNH